MNNRFKDLLVFGFILFIFFVWFFREIFQGYLFYFSDLTYYFYPYRHYLVESVKSGYFPLWNPYIFAGYPFFATLQTWTLYPITVLFYFLPFDFAFNLSIIIHYPLAFLFTYLLCREFKMSRWASLISGFVFAFSGFLLSVLHMPTTLAPAAWLPLLIIFIRRAFLLKDFFNCSRNTIFSAFFLTLMFLGGEPTVLLATVLFVFFYICYDGFVRKKPDFLRNFLILSSAGIIFVFLASVQLCPFLEFIFNSVRSRGVSFEEATAWSLGPHKLLSFLVPYLFHLDIFSFSTLEWAKSFYLGIVPIILMICSFIFVKNKRFLFIALIVSFLLAFGSRTPFFWFFYKFVPFFGFIRYPQKFILISTFLISLLAGFGFDGLCDEIKKNGSRFLNNFLKFFFVVIVLLFVLFIILFSQQNIAEFITRRLLFEELAQINSINVDFVYQRNIINFGFQCLLLTLVWMLIRFSAQTGKITILKITIMFLLVVDVFSANYKSNFSIKDKYYYLKAPVMEIVKKDKDLFRVGVSPKLRRAKIFWTYNEIIDFKEGVVELRNILTENQNMLYKVSLLDGYESITDPYIIDMQEAINRLNPKKDQFADIDLLNLLNFKYLLTDQGFNIRGYKLIFRDKMKLRGKDIFLFENSNYFPRVMALPRCKIIKKEENVLKYISSPRYFGRREVVLEEKIPGFDFSKNKINQASYDVKLEKYSAGEVKIAVSLKQPGILLLTDRFYPGWKVYVNGKEEKIYKADYMFRAVPLKKGKYTVAFSYEPLSFKIGFYVSLLTSICLIGYLFRRKL